MNNKPAPGMPQDVYYKKTLTLRAWKQELDFLVSQDLFSSFDIDKGTRLLLRTIVEQGYEYRSVLDLGCGYGPLGLTLKKLRPESALTMVDRDALAVDYSRQNSALNNIDGSEIYGSLGYDDVTKTGFDLIVSNIPGKAGPRVIPYLLEEARYCLAPEGTAAVVVVNPLAEQVLQALKLPGIEVVFTLTRSAHTVFHYRFTGPPAPKPSSSAFERGIYDRAGIKMHHSGLDYEMNTVYGLPEFDSLHHATGLLMDVLTGIGLKPGSNITVYNPGQGHAAAFAWKTLEPQNITLIDRDLLALRAARRNLLLNGCPAERVQTIHRPGAEHIPQTDLFLGVAREDEGQHACYKLLADALGSLAGKGWLALSGTSTAITRLIARAEDHKLALAVRDRRKQHGFSSLAARKT